MLVQVILLFGAPREENGLLIIFDRCNQLKNLLAHIQAQI